jgi:hypothetical protein
LCHIGQSEALYQFGCGHPFAALVFSAWTSFNDLGRFVWGKAFCPTGIGLVTDLLPIATHSHW